MAFGRAVPRPIESRPVKQLNRSKDKQPDPLAKKTVVVSEVDDGEGGLTLGMTKESTGWDVYNNEAKKVDTELIKDWTTNLNSLLLFAAIFAAMLTAFIIESKKLLEPDLAAVMVDVMIAFSNNFANGTHNPYVQDKFQPPSAAVTINCLFFASLSTSLVAALASVVAFQWIADYDAAITRGGSSPEDRAKRRHFRHAGVISWKMGEVIAIIPLLLYCSVALFFIGLAIWMWGLDRTVGIVITGGAGLALLFYGGSTLLAVLFVSAPFRTPLSRWIYSISHLPFSFAYLLARAAQVPSPLTWLEKRHRSGTQPYKREDREVEERGDLAAGALVWLANQLSISQDSYRRLLLLTSELPNLSKLPDFEEAPWLQIFDLLGQRYLKNGPNEVITVDEMRAVTTLARCYCIPEARTIVNTSKSVDYITDNTTPMYWSQLCDAREAGLPLNSRTQVHSLFLYLRDIPVPSLGALNEQEASIRLSRWRNSPKKSHNIWNEVLDLGIESSTSFFQAYIEILGPFIKANEVAFRGDDNTRLLYTTVLDRVIQALANIEGKVSPKYLALLQVAFESLLLDNTDTDTPMPERYRQSLRSSPTELHWVHYALTLLFAKQLRHFSGAERIRQMEEVLIMLWAPPVRGRLVQHMVSPHGTLSVFEANKDIIAQWVVKSNEIPYIHEVLHHLNLAQAAAPEIGPLWRVSPSGNLMNALLAFDQLLRQDATPTQYHTLIDLICRDIQLRSPDVFDRCFSGGHMRDLHEIKDPCLRFLIKSIGGPIMDTIYPSSAEQQTHQSLSWSRIAVYLMEYHEGSKSSLILQMQATLWPSFPNEKSLCQRALMEPQILAWLKRIFEYPMACSHHYCTEGHLLLHISPYLHAITPGCSIVRTIEIAIPPGTMEALSILLIYKHPYHDSLVAKMADQTSKECWDQVEHMFDTVTESRFSYLAILCDHSLNLLLGSFIRPNDFVGILAAIRLALGYPSDYRVAPIIRPLIGHVLKLKDRMFSTEWYSKPATRLINKESDQFICQLISSLAILVIDGDQNSKMLSCARASGPCSPAIGWLPPYID